MFASFSLSFSLYFFLFSFSLPHFLSLSLPFSPFLISPSPIRSFSQCTRISNRRRNLNTTARRGTFHFFFLCIPPPFPHSVSYMEKKQGCINDFFSFILSIDKHQQSRRSLYLHQFPSSIFTPSHLSILLRSIVSLLQNRDSREASSCDVKKKKRLYSRRFIRVFFIFSFLFFFFFS